MKAYIALIFLCIFSHSAKAQDMFVGFADFCGLPVVVGADPQTASARTDNSGQQYLHVDPGAMNNWTMSRMFTLAHECAHHLLGHTSALGQLQRYKGGTANQELEADCWGARKLLQVGQTGDINGTVIQFASQGHFTGGGYPSGTERATNIMKCLNGGSSVSHAPVCNIVQVPESYMGIQTVMQPAQVPCQHCGCNQFGQCGCMHQFDVVPQPVQVPVPMTRMVAKNVCQ
jgi:hypothetical protein